MTKHRSQMLRALLPLLFIFGVSSSFADDDTLVIDAGVDQVVNAGDVVQLAASITRQEEENEHHRHGDKGDRHHHRGDKGDRDHHSKDNNGHHDGDSGHGNGHHGDNRRHRVASSHRRHHDNDDWVILWTQTSGSPVALQDADTLSPTFTTETYAQADEVLGFQVTLSDHGGRLVSSDHVNVTVLAPRSTISGRISSVDGSALANASINVLSGGASVATLSTGPDGHFSTQLIADISVVLQLSDTGFADQVVPAHSPNANGNVFLDIKMIPRGQAQSFNVDAGATLNGDDGASVSVAPGSFVDAAGNVVTGNVDVTITPVDIANPATLAAFPGEFSGVLEGDSTDTPFVSLGTVEFEFSQNGQPLQLGVGQTASVIIPIYESTYQDGTPIYVGDAIPLWSLDQGTGIWTQEGNGTVINSPDSPTGLAMQATVSHFSWWNCDVSMNAAQAIVTVYGPDAGTALIKAHTNADIGWRPDTVYTVGNVNAPTGPLHVPSNGEVCYWAEIYFDNGSTGTTPEVCSTAPPNSLIYVDLVAPIAGPINIMTRPADAAGTLNVTAYINYPAPPVGIQPTTFETTVTYSIVSGSLPPGMSLNPVTVASAEIAGVPTVGGEYSVVVEATDADGDTDTVTVNYSVSADVPPPMLSSDINEVPYNAVPATIDLTAYNSGGAASSWALSENISSENGPPPSGLSLDPATGILTVSDYCIFWEGYVTATNSSGSDMQRIYIYDNGCY